MTVPKKIVDIFITRTFIARDRGERTEVALFQKQIVNNYPLRLYMDEPSDIDLVLELQKVNPKMRLHEIVLTNKAIIDPLNIRFVDGRIESISSGLIKKL